MQVTAVEATDINNDCYRIGVTPASLSTTDENKVYLERNNGVLSQEMFKDERGRLRSGIIYVIRYDYLLKSDITIPEKCVLVFDGGSLRGAYAIIGSNTGIQADLVKIFNDDVKFKGNWNVKEAYPEWFGAVGDDEDIDNAIALNACMRSGIAHTISFSKSYYISQPVYCSPSTLFRGCGKFCGIVANSNFHSINVTVKGKSREVNALLYAPGAYYDPQFEHMTFDGGYLSETVCETFAFSAHFRYSDCLVQRFYGVGIYLAFSDNAYVRDSYVRYCNIGIGFGDNRINTNNPWDASGEYRGKTNHVLLDNNNVQFCNIGVYTAGGADMTLSNHLSGHNALWALYCKDLYNVLIDEFYSEDDFCCNFFVKKGMRSDPKLNSDKSFNRDLYTFFNKSPKQRSLMFLAGNCSYIINTLEIGLYNLRLYEGCNTNRIENDSLSGIDAIIHAGSGIIGGISINGKWLVNNYFKVNNVVKGNKYDICSSMRYNVTPNITSSHSLKMLNYNMVRGTATIDRTPIVDRLLAFSINNSQNLSINRDDNNYYYSSSYAGIESQRENQGNYTYVKTVGNISFYSRDSYFHQVNSVRINPSELNGGCTYAAIIHYYTDETKTGACGFDVNVKYSGKEGSEFRPCYYVPSLKAKQILTCVVYFTKEDFIKNGKLAQYLYFSEREDNSSLLSSPISIWKVGSREEPVCLSFKESGNSKSRPTPIVGEEIGLVYFDTTIGKPIYWSGNNWVDVNGSRVE